MPLIVATQADLNAYLEAQDRLRAAEAPLTDTSVRGQQRALDALAAADPYGLRTQLPATVEELARLKDTSVRGMQGATALIRVVENREDLTDKSVRGQTRARNLLADVDHALRGDVATPREQPAAKPAAPTPVQQQEPGLVDQAKALLDRAKSTVLGWIGRD